ncbi:MAG: hypothetical protein WC654_01960 [Patescibacteria group bacterium]
MQKCPDPHCRFKTNKSGGMDSHMRTNPHHQAGYKFGVYKGHKSGQKSPKNDGKGDQAKAK